MATFRKRNKFCVEARVQRKGYRPISRSFPTMQLAKQWARKIEGEIDAAKYGNLASYHSITVKEVMLKYIEEVTLKSRSAKTNHYKHIKLTKHPIAKLRLSELKPQHIAAYRDERLKKVKAGTVISELAFLSAMINHAKREYFLEIQNPVLLVKKPQTPRGRQRVLSLSEKERILDALIPTPRRRVNPLIKPVFEFALETAMRMGEILSLHWKNIDLDRRLAHLPITKNGEERYVPLSLKAAEILRNLPVTSPDVVFPIKVCTLSSGFLTATIRAGVEDFHFHDLRHTAITNLSKKVSNLLELAAISGHKSVRMLSRYTHIKPEDLLSKIDS